MHEVMINHVFHAWQVLYVFACMTILLMQAPE
jgi:hypothetical protein